MKKRTLTVSCGRAPSQVILESVVCITLCVVPAETILVRWAALSDDLDSRTSQTHRSTLNSQCWIKTRCHSSSMRISPLLMVSRLSPDVVLLRVC